jgi:hypothetical protein
MNIPELPTTPSGLYALYAILGAQLLTLLVNVLVWRLRVRDSMVHNAASGPAMSDNDERAVIAHKEPPEPGRRAPLSS